MAVSQGSKCRRLAIAALGFLAFFHTEAGNATEIEIGGTGSALGTARILLDTFMASEPDMSGKVLPSLGSSGGIKALLSGSIDLAVSTRLPKEREKAAGATGIKYGTTAVVFAVPDGNAVNGLSSADILDIYRGKQRFWPDGTRVRLILRPKSESDNVLFESYLPEMAPLGEALRSKPNTPVTYSDQETADAILSAPGGLGKTTLALILSEERALKPLALNGVAADAESIANGSYPVTKSFYFIVKGEPSPEVARFLAFVRSSKGQAVLRRLGHVPATG